MTTPTKIYDNATAGVSFWETLDKITIVLPPNYDATYSPHFTNAGCSREQRADGVALTCDKTNTRAIQIMDKMIGGSVSSLYQHRAAPVAGPSLLGPAAGPAGISMSMIQAAASVPQQSVAGAAGEAVYPIKLIYKNDQAGLQIVDYSPYAVVMFAPPEWGQQNSAALTARGGMFNFKLKADPEGKTKAPGWVFKKSDENSRKFLQELTGEDVVAKAAPVPQKGKWGGRGGSTPYAQPSFQPAIQNAGAAAPAAPAPVIAAAGQRIVGSLPLPVPAGLSGAAVIPGMPQAPASPPKPVTPADALGELLDMLSAPITKAQRKELVDIAGNVRMGFFGPTAETKAMVEAYIAEFPTAQFATATDIEVTHSGNTVAVVTRTN
ncbi:Hypothetical protein POVN_LOCUS689 [uncultured virus]|nr:Hypothetical protein POVN_LOCUS689 [uncultured virus]